MSNCVIQLEDLPLSFAWPLLEFIVHTLTRLSCVATQQLFNIRVNWARGLSYIRVSRLFVNLHNLPPSIFSYLLILAIHGPARLVHGRAQLGQMNSLTLCRFVGRIDYHRGDDQSFVRSHPLVSCPPCNQLKY